MLLRHDPSLGGYFSYGRSGPCCLSFGFSAVFFPNQARRSSRRPRRLGSHRLWNFRAGSFRGAGLLLLRLHRPLGNSSRSRVGVRVHGSSRSVSGIFGSGNFDPPLLNRSFERATIIVLSSAASLGDRHFPALNTDEESPNTRGQETHARRCQHDHLR